MHPNVRGGQEQHIQLATFLDLLLVGQLTRLLPPAWNRLLIPDLLDHVLDRAQRDTYLGRYLVPDAIELRMCQLQIALANGHHLLICRLKRLDLQARLPLLGFPRRPGLLWPLLGMQPMWLPLRPCPWLWLVGNGDRRPLGPCLDRMRGRGRGRGRWG